MDNSQLNQFVFDFGYGLMNEEIMNMVVAKFIERYGVLGGAKETERWELACKVMKEALVKAIGPDDPPERIAITRKLRSLVTQQEQPIVSILIDIIGLSMLDIFR